MKFRPGLALALPQFYLGPVVLLQVIAVASVRQVPAVLLAVRLLVEETHVVAILKSATLKRPSWSQRKLLKCERSTRPLPKWKLALALTL